MKEQYAKPVFDSISQFKQSIIGHYIFISVSGGILTIAALRTINPVMAWKKAIWSGIAVGLLILALLVGAHFAGVTK